MTLLFFATSCFGRLAEESKNWGKKLALSQCAETSCECWQTWKERKPHSIAQQCNAQHLLYGSVWYGMSRWSNCPLTGSCNKTQTWQAKDEEEKEKEQDTKEGAEDKETADASSSLALGILSACKNGTWPAKYNNGQAMKRMKHQRTNWCHSKMMPNAC